MNKVACLRLIIVTLIVSGVAIGGIGLQNSQFQNNPALNQIIPSNWTVQLIDQKQCYDVRIDRGTAFDGTIEDYVNSKYLYSKTLDEIRSLHQNTFGDYSKSFFAEGPGGVGNLFNLILRTPAGEFIEVGIHEKGPDYTKDFTKCDQLIPLVSALRTYYTSE